MIIAAKDVSPNASPMRSTHSVVAIIDVGKQEKSLLIPVEITAERTMDGQRLDVNVLSSAYGKNAEGLIAEAVARENIGDVGVYYIKKEATNLIGAGVQFPTQLQAAASSNGIIRYFPEKVNMKILEQAQSQQFKRWFGDWQNNPKKASKIVNADGTPKVVYHGTNKYFNVFQSNNGMYWFSESKDYAESMAEERAGERVMPVYLNMRNPYKAKLKPGQFSDPSAEAPIIKAAKAGNYDGIIIEADTDNELAKDTFYVVFSPTQIKSAEDNVGTFDKGNPDIRYSLMQTKSGESFVMVENAMTNAKLNDPKVIADYIASHIGEMYTVIESGQKVYIGKDLPNEYTRSKYSQSIIQGGKKKAKNKAVSNLGEMVEIATNRRWEKPRHSQNKDAAYGIYRYDTTFAFPVKGTPDTYRAYDAELIIRNASDGKKYLYDIVGIKENTGLVLDLNQKARGRQYAAAQSSASNDSLPQTEPAVNSYSMQNPDIDAQGDYSLMDTLLVDNTTKKAVSSIRPQTLSSFEPITASSMGSNSFSADRVPQTEPAVNTHSMQNSDIDAQGDYSLMDTLPQEKPPQQETQQP